MLKIGVLVSGRGSNLQALMDAIGAKKIDAEIAVVISNVSGAFALERARKAGIRTVVAENESQIEKALKDSGVGLVCLAGYMKILSPEFVRKFKGRIMNIHPALLPAFPGLHVQKKALEYGVKFAGCTVHFVDEGCDTGPIIIQSVVPVKDSDTVESLTERILDEEHRIYPEAVRLFAEGKLKIEGRRVKIV